LFPEGGELKIGTYPDKVVIAQMDKIAFPEICPVCLDEADDLVPISIYEKEEDRRYLTVRSEGKDQVAPFLAERKGAVTFWIPTCLFHGSKSVATTKKKVMSIVGFMILFYPLLFYILGVITALQYDRPLIPVAAPLAGIFIAVVAIIGYGFYPRALERHLKFIDIDRATSRFSVFVKNDEYRKSLIEQNEMHASLATEMTDS
jgi:hypothetical protein